jgi:subtilisin family serine protease
MPTPVKLRTIRTALTFAVLVGCEPLSDDAVEPGGSETRSDDSILASVDDTGVDTGSAHAAVHIPSLLRAALAADGVARVIVEMRTIEVPGLSRSSGEARIRLLARRAEQYADTRAAVLSRISGDARLENQYTHLPLITLEVSTERDLEQLALDRNVVGIHVDERFEAVLDDSLALICQFEAAAEGHTGAGTAVAVLDTGLDYRHSDFGSCTAVGEPSGCRVVAMEDFAAADGKLDDSSGHGTNVAAIVGGVAPGTDLIGLDVFRNNGYAYTSEVVAGIDWVIEHQAEYNIVALNMSLGGGNYSAECPGTSYDIAMTAALEAGVASAVATGNNGWNNRIASPACAPSAVKVGAVYDNSYGTIRWSGCTDSTTEADKVTCFSNSASFVDLLAPGALIDAGGYRMGGTSQATPHVAGALAVMAAAYPMEDPEDWTQRLIDTGVSITDHRNSLSFPRIDVEAAVADAQDCAVSLDVSDLPVPVAGGTGSFAVRTGTSCSWSVSTDAAWLAFSPASGTGADTVTWTAAANAGDARVGGASVEADGVTFTQAGNAPPVATVTIDAGASYTASRTLSLSISASDPDDAVAEMCVANVDGDASATCSAWEAVSTAKSWWSSAGQGEKEVGVWVRDSRGRVSEVVTDSIILDTVAPTGASLSALSINGGAVLTWTAATDAGAGVDAYWVQYASGGSAPSDCARGTRAYSGPGLTTTVNGLPNGQIHGFRLCGTDTLGNDASLATATVTPSESAGAPGTLTINDGAYWTNQRVVTLSMTPGISAATEMCISNTSACDTWQTASEAVSWTLPGEQGAHTVYLWYRNAYGQESPPTTASAGLDTLRPSDGSLTVVSVSRRATLAWSGHEDIGSGVDAYVVRMQPGTKAPRNCVSGTEVYRGSASSAVVAGLTNGVNYAVRMCAVDEAGNYSVGSSALLAPASSGPRGSIVLNSGDIWTDDRRVSVSVQSFQATEMCISNQVRCNRWFPIQASFGYNIPRRQGEVVVYAAFRDAAGNVSTLASDSIRYDDRAPGDGDITIEKDDRRLDVSWSSASDSHSGVVGYIIVAAEDSVIHPHDCDQGTLLWEGDATSASLTGLTNSQPYALRVCAVDEAGNRSAGATAIGWPGTDETEPVGSVVVNANAAWTNTRRVELEFSVSDDDAGVRDVCVSTKTAECTAWTPFTATYTTNLGSKQGEQFLYAWVRDHQGNVSEMMSDAIGYDTRTPGGGSLSAGQGNGRIPLSWEGFSDSASGVATYKVAYVAGSRLQTCGHGVLAYEGTGTSVTISGLDNGASYLFGVCAIDEAGNMSRPITVTGRPASEYDAPTGSIVVAGGATYTAKGRTTIAVSASDPSGVTRMCVSLSQTCRRWTAFAETATVTLPSKTREHTVHVWLSDGQGNMSETPLSDSVFVDSTAPTEGRATAAPIAGGMSFHALGFADGHSGMDGYILTARAGTRSPPKCQGSSALVESTRKNFSVTGLKSGTAYSFRVCGVDAVGNVSKGVIVHATPR